MSPDGGKPVRAYRPSRCIGSEQDSDDAEVVRTANVETYAQRVSLGKPLFEEERTEPAR
jgi:hypothetical protein